MGGHGSSGLPACNSHPQGRALRAGSSSQAPGLGVEGGLGCGAPASAGLPRVARSPATWGNKAPPPPAMELI